MLKQFLRLKKFFIIRILFSFFFFILSIFIIKLVQFFLPVVFLGTLTGFCIAAIFFHFLSRVLLSVLDFMQIYYCYESNQNIPFCTLLKQIMQALKSLFEKDNCYLKLIRNLMKADTFMKDKLYEDIEESNPYFYLLEFRSNSVFQYVFDRFTNSILTCTFYYIIVTDSDLTLEDYAKGAIFYRRVFPLLFSSVIKSAALTHFISVAVSIILLLIIHHNITFILIFFFVFHRMILCAVKDMFVIFYLSELTESSNEAHENDNSIEPSNETQENDNSTEPSNEVQDIDSPTEDTTPFKIKSSLSDIARANSDFSMPKQVNTENTSLSSMLNQWRKNNNNKDSSNEDTLLKRKDAHKYFKLDNEQMKNLTNYKEEPLQDNSVVSNNDKNLFTIDDISTEIKELDVDFLLHIDEI